MFPRCPVLVVAFVFFFPAASAGDPVPVQNFTRKVGESVIFPVDVPKGITVKDVFLRTTLWKKAVAFWQQGEPLTTVDPKYSGRVSFSKNPYSFRISSLRVADGELYEASVSPGEPAETVINTYRLSVFNITTTAKKLDNGSCSISLLCQAGMGPGDSVTYHWTYTASGTTLARNSHLQVVMDPAERKTSYTCTASRADFQSNWAIAPYEQLCSGVAGLFKPGLLAWSYLALLSILVSVLMLP